MTKVASFITPLYSTPIPVLSNRTINKVVQSMIQILKVPESILGQSAAVFTTYTYILANRFKRSKAVKVNYDTLAEQMDIDIRHVKTYIKELVNEGFIEVSEPNIKKNGLNGAVTITLMANDKHYVIVPLSIMLDGRIPKTYRQYYARLKRVINLNTFTTFKSPTELQQELGCKTRTYGEFMKFMKETIIDGQVLIVDASTNKEYKIAMEYERYVANNHSNNEADIKRAIRRNNKVNKDETHSNHL